MALQDDGDNVEWIKIARFVGGPDDLDEYRQWLTKHHPYTTIEQLKAQDYWPAVLKQRPELAEL